MQVKFLATNVQQYKVTNYYPYYILISEFLSNHLIIHLTFCKVFQFVVFLIIVTFNRSTIIDVTF